MLIIRVILVLMVPKFSMLFGAIGCSPNWAGFEFQVEGKEFLNAEVIIDGKSVGYFTQVIKNRTGEILTQEGKGVSRDDFPLRENEKECLGYLSSVKLKPGLHRFVFQAATGNRVQIEAFVRPGEHYVVYSSIKNQIIWNDQCYEVTSDQIITIKE